MRLIVLSWIKLSEVYSPRVIHYNLFNLIMERYLKPDRPELNTSDPDSNDKWLHWRDMFAGFLSELQSSSTSALTSSQKLTLLLHHISNPIYKCLSVCQNYDAAISTLDGMFIKKKNSIFARYLLATRRQKTEEGLELYLQNLKILSYDCDFTALTASQARDIAIRDAFFSGVRSNQIRQRMLENKDLDLATAYELALTLDMAHNQISIPNLIFQGLLFVPSLIPNKFLSQIHSIVTPRIRILQILFNNLLLSLQLRLNATSAAFVNTLVPHAQLKTVDVIYVASRDIF